MSEKRIDWRTATDAEKCAAVAIVCGWRHEPRFEDPEWMVWREPGYFGDAYHLHCPDYLRDPRAWWPLVEDCNDASAQVMAGKFMATRRPEIGKLGYSAWAPTIGEAVCIAYLRSQGWEVVT